MSKIVLLILLFFLSINSVLPQILKIDINNIRNKKGVIRIAIFKNSESFNKDEAFISKILCKKTIENGQLAIEFEDIPKGVYGIAVLDDEDENGSMTYNFFGYPLEGCGFSDYYHTGILRPKFDNFKFHFKEDKTVVVKIKYY